MLAQLSHYGRASLGIFVLIACAYFLSRDRKNIKWRIVWSGLGFIIVLAFLMLKVSWAQFAINQVSMFFIRLMEFSDIGAAFVFGDLVTNTKSYGYIVAFHILPNIIFFAAFSSLLYYFKILPKIVKGFAFLLTHTFQLSGAECLAAAANVFLSQITAPLLIKPYLATMSRSEMFCVMTSGMATISGTVMIAFIGILGGEDPVARLQFANNLLIVSILSAPAALVIAHIMIPKHGPVDKDVEIHYEDMGANVVDAFSKGTDEGLRVALIIGAILISFTALISLCNWALADGVGALLGINPLIAKLTGGFYDAFTLQFVFGILFAPFAWVIGVPTPDLLYVGQLLGEKVVLNEIVAYISLGNGLRTGQITDPHSITLASYALCSFANFTSMGVQICGFGALAANQRSTVSRLAFLAVISGNLACFLSSTIAVALTF